MQRADGGSVMFLPEQHMCWQLATIFNPVIIFSTHPLEKSCFHCPLPPLLITPGVSLMWPTRMSGEGLWVHDGLWKRGSDLSISTPAFLYRLLWKVCVWILFQQGTHLLHLIFVLPCAFLSNTPEFMHRNPLWQRLPFWAQHLQQQDTQAHFNSESGIFFI